MKKVVLSCFGMLVVALSSSLNAMETAEEFFFTECIGLAFQDEEENGEMDYKEFDAFVRGCEAAQDDANKG